MQMKYLSSSSSPNSPSFLQKSMAVVGTLAAAAVALVFSAVLLAFLISAGVVMFAYLWWKFRSLRRRMRDQPKGCSVHGASLQRGAFGAETFQGDVFEGEVIRVDETTKPRSANR